MVVPTLDLTTYCTRCHQDNTDARDVYYPLSDEYLQLCTDCEPEDTAISPFELWHYPRPTDEQIEAMLEAMAELDAMESTETYHS